MLTNTMRKSQSGMTLIELMIALVVGLIVIGAAISLVVSLMRSNNESIRSMRLSQEMRALADVATMEIRRARSVSDPLANVGQGAAAFQNCNAITLLGTQCMTFGYDCNVNTGKFRLLRVANQQLQMAESNSALDCSAPPAGNAITTLNSPELLVDNVAFSQTATGAIQMSLQASLRSDATVRRTMTRVIYPRSAPVTP